MMKCDKSRNEANKAEHNKIIRFLRITRDLCQREWSRYLDLINGVGGTISGIITTLLLLFILTSCHSDGL